MAQLSLLLLKEARPRQWLKNLSLYTGLIFSGWLFWGEKFWTVTLAWLTFSILTSSLYIFNDIIDLNSDRQHPFKKFRPLAAGKIPLPTALFFSLTGLFISL